MAPKDSMTEYIMTRQQVIFTLLFANSPQFIHQVQLHRLRGGKSFQIAKIIFFKVSRYITQNHTKYIESSIIIAMYRKTDGII